MKPSDQHSVTQAQHTQTGTGLTERFTRAVRRVTPASMVDLTNLAAHESALLAYQKRVAAAQREPMSKVDQKTFIGNLRRISTHEVKATEDEGKQVELHARRFHQIHNRHMSILEELAYVKHLQQFRKQLADEHIRSALDTKRDRAWSRFGKLLSMTKEAKFIRESANFFALELPANTQRALTRREVAELEVFGDDATLLPPQKLAFISVLNEFSESEVEKLTYEDMKLLAIKSVVYLKQNKTAMPAANQAEFLRQLLINSPLRSTLLEQYSSPGAIQAISPYQTVKTKLTAERAAAIRGAHQQSAPELASDDQDERSDIQTRQLPAPMPKAVRDAVVSGGGADPAKRREQQLRRLRVGGLSASYAAPQLDDLSGSRSTSLTSDDAKSAPAPRRTLTPQSPQSRDHALLRAFYSYRGMLALGSMNVDDRETFGLLFYGLEKVIHENLADRVLQGTSLEPLYERYGLQTQTGAESELCNEIYRHGEELSGQQATAWGSKLNHAYKLALEIVQHQLGVMADEASAAPPEYGRSSHAHQGNASSFDDSDYSNSYGARREPVPAGSDGDDDGYDGGPSQRREEGRHRLGVLPMLTSQMAAGHQPQPDRVDCRPQDRVHDPRVVPVQEAKVPMTQDEDAAHAPRASAAAAVAEPVLNLTDEQWQAQREAGREDRAAASRERIEERKAVRRQQRWAEASAKSARGTEEERARQKQIRDYDSKSSITRRNKQPLQHHPMVQRIILGQGVDGRDISYSKKVCGLDAMLRYYYRELGLKGSGSISPLRAMYEQAYTAKQRSYNEFEPRVVLPRRWRHATSGNDRYKRHAARVFQAGLLLPQSISTMGAVAYHIMELLAHITPVKKSYSVNAYVKLLFEMLNYIPGSDTRPALDAMDLQALHVFIQTLTPEMTGILSTNLSQAGGILSGCTVATLAEAVHAASVRVETIGARATEPGAVPPMFALPSGKTWAACIGDDVEHGHLSSVTRQMYDPRSDEVSDHPLYPKYYKQRISDKSQWHHGLPATTTAREAIYRNVHLSMQKLWDRPTFFSGVKGNQYKEAVEELLQTRNVLAPDKWNSAIFVQSTYNSAHINGPRVLQDGARLRAMLHAAELVQLSAAQGELLFDLPNREHAPWRAELGALLLSAVGQLRELYTRLPVLSEGGLPGAGKPEPQLVRLSAYLWSLRGFLLEGADRQYTEVVDAQQALSDVLRVAHKIHVEWFSHFGNTALRDPSIKGKRQYDVSRSVKRTLHALLTRALANRYINYFEALKQKNEIPKDEGLRHLFRYSQNRRVSANKLYALVIAYASMKVAEQKYLAEADEEYTRFTTRTRARFKGGSVFEASKSRRLRNVQACLDKLNNFMDAAQSGTLDDFYDLLSPKTSSKSQGFADICVVTRIELLRCPGIAEFMPQRHQACVKAFKGARKLSAYELSVYAELSEGFPGFRDIKADDVDDASPSSPAPKVSA